jgi:hypothetical protein
MLYEEINPEKTERLQKKAIGEKHSRDEHSRAMAAAGREFDAAFREWRVGRIEYKKMVAAIKREATEAEIELAAAGAGCTPNDWAPLIAQRRRALRAMTAAKELPAAQRRFDELEKQYRQLDEQYPKAKNVCESERILEEIRPIADRRQAAARELSDVQMEAETVEAAKKAGLI